MQFNHLSTTPEDYQDHVFREVLESIHKIYPHKKINWAHEVVFNKPNGGNKLD